MVTFRCYWRPKSDHTIGEWEDGAAFSEARGVAAIADGASSSFDAARWARELTRSFISNPPRTVDAEAFEAWTVAVAAAFEGLPAVAGADRVEPPDEVVGLRRGVVVEDEGRTGDSVGLRHGRPFAEPVLAVGQWGPARTTPRASAPVVSEQPPDLPSSAPGAGADTDAGTVPDAVSDAPEPQSATTAPWYVQEAAVRGSFATFLGLQFTETPDARRWRVMAVGDACCFHVRGSSMMAAFPVDDPDAFGSAPDLLSSQPFRGSHGGHRLQVLTGSLESGDTFYLATDAVAAWLLGRVRMDPTIWSSLRSLDHEGFAALVEDARRSGEMADDDATLMRAVVGPSGDLREAG